MLKRFEGGLETVLLIFGRIFTSAMLVITVADILSRNTFNLPIPGVVDMVEFSLAITIFAGIAVATLRGAHLAVDLLEVLLPERVLRLLEDVNGLLGFASFSVLAWLSYARFADAIDWGDKTVDLGIPLGWFWLSPVIGFSCAALFSLIRSFRHFRAGAGDK